jgi:hypothetical protein
MRVRHYILVLAACLGFLPLHCCTNLTGDVSGVLLLNDSPYQVEQDIVIPEHSTLEIEAGVRVEFAPGAGLTVYGDIQANGSEDARIHFTLWEDRREEFNLSDTSVRLADGDGPDSGRSNYLYCLYYCLYQ